MTEATEDAEPANNVLAPTFRYQHHKTRYQQYVNKLCKADSEVYERTLRVVKGMGATSKQVLKGVLRRNESSGLGTSMEVLSDSGVMPTYEIIDPNMQASVATKSKMCHLQWDKKASSIMKNSFGAAKASTAILKKVFQSNLAANCDMCVKVVNNELDPNREFGTYDSGVSSKKKFCGKYSAKLTMARCEFIFWCCPSKCIR